MPFSELEKAFIVEFYAKSYGIGQNGGPSLQFVSGRFGEPFNKRPPTKRPILFLLRKYRITGPVLSQRKGRSGRRKSSRNN